MMDLLKLEYCGPFNIEFKELGIWISLDVLQDLDDAIYCASGYVNVEPTDAYYNAQTDEKYRIIDNNNKII